MKNVILQDLTLYFPLGRLRGHPVEGRSTCYSCMYGRREKVSMGTFPSADGALLVKLFVTSLLMYGPQSQADDRHYHHGVNLIFPDVFDKTL